MYFSRRGSESEVEYSESSKSEDKEEMKNIIERRRRNGRI
jgi:hypothetical protein